MKTHFSRLIYTGRSCSFLTSAAIIGRHLCLNSRIWFMLCLVYINPIVCRCWYPEKGTSSIDWAKLSRFYLKTEAESSFRNVVFWKINRMVFLDKARTMDNVQKHNICTRWYVSPRRRVHSELHGVTTHKTQTLRCHPTAEERSYVTNESWSHSVVKQGRS
jgi:hypothetical protein